MIKLHGQGAYLAGGTTIIPADADAPAKLQAAAGRAPSPAEAKKDTIAYGIHAREQAVVDIHHGIGML